MRYLLKLLFIIIMITDFKSAIPAEMQGSAWMQEPYVAHVAWQPALTHCQVRWQIVKLKRELKRTSMLCCLRRKKRLQMELEEIEEEWETRHAELIAQSKQKQAHEKK